MFWRIVFSIAAIFSLSYDGQAQQITPDKIGFTPFSFTDKELGEVNYYISSKSIEEKKPVLLYLDGSGAYPLFQYTDKGIASSVAFDYNALAEQYHVILISKPGVPFIDTVSRDSMTGYPYYPEPKEYIDRLLLDWRVNAASQILKKLKAHVKYDDHKVAVMGISEGFQVGARLAAVDKRVTHLMLFVGNGLNQFFDFIIQNRLEAQTGELPEEVAQANIDSLYVVIRDIYNDPLSTSKSWYGHTYLRWSSFCNTNPTDNLMHLSIPIYLVAASKDRNTTALSADYLFLESLRYKKFNITYKVYPYDHSLNELVTDPDGRVISAKPHIREVINEGLVWLQQF
jgi:pimeloyl-ACP methyl ester carboxylesterase